MQVNPDNSLAEPLTCKSTTVSKPYNLDSMEKKVDYTIAMTVSRLILLMFYIYIVIKIRDFVINPDKGTLIENVNRSTN